MNSASDDTQHPSETQSPRRKTFWRTSLIPIAIVFVIGAGIWVYMKYEFRRLRSGVSLRATCLNNGRKTLIAMLNHASQNRGRLAPAITVGPTGEPLHGWRTTMLPYLDNVHLHHVIDHEQAWDAAVNRPFHDVPNSQLTCPASSDPKENRTNWFAITGEETLFPGAEFRTLDEVSDADGLANTLMFIEATGMNIPWMEPRDIPFSALTRSPVDLKGVGPSSDHRNGSVNVMFADGHGTALNKNIDPAVLRALAGWNDGISTDGQF